MTGFRGGAASLGDRHCGSPCQITQHASFVQFLCSFLSVTGERMKSVSGKQQVAIKEKVNVEACLSASSVRPRVMTSIGGGWDKRHNRGHVYLGESVWEILLVGVKRCMQLTKLPYWKRDCILIKTTSFSKAFQLGCNSKSAFEKAHWWRGEEHAWIECCSPRKAASWCRFKKDFKSGGFQVWLTHNSRHKMQKRHPLNLL